jgi:hypothetical protein
LGADRGFQAPNGKASRFRRGTESKNGRGQLHPDATVTFAAERAEAGIDEIMAGLDRDLVGLAVVKKRVEEIASLLLVDKARQRFGLTAPRPNLHMCFTGAPGTGKTTVALRMAELLCRLGYIESANLVHAMRDDLVGQYIGQTAPKTKRVLEKAKGGVLFIDEAYYLFRETDSKDYGQEAIDILLQVMENDRENLVVILAGYYLSPEAEKVFRAEVERMMSEPHFANARTVRNELELARLRHAHRIASEPHRTYTRDDLMRLTPGDVLARRSNPAPVRTP